MADTLHRPIVTLITDFGLNDPYVGQLKGALLKGCFNLLPIDVTHAIARGDVAAAAVALHTSFGHFPEGSIHLAVVDPTVGTKRDLLAAAGGGHFFLAPDNGIFSLLLIEGMLEQAHAIVKPDWIQASSISPAFHGRDLLAPAAAALAYGRRLEELGPQRALADLRKFELAVFDAGCTGTVQARVLSIDHFGNIRLNCRLDAALFAPGSLHFIAIGGKRISAMMNCYAEAKTGDLLMLVDSCGYLEVAINQGNAAEILHCSPGDTVMVHFH